jgi:hypothetical protein
MIVIRFQWLQAAGVPMPTNEGPGSKHIPVPSFGQGCKSMADTVLIRPTAVCGVTLVCLKLAPIPAKHLYAGILNGSRAEIINLLKTRDIGLESGFGDNLALLAKVDSRMAEWMRQNGVDMQGVILSHSQRLHKFVEVAD